MNKKYAKVNVCQSLNHGLLNTVFSKPWKKNTKKQKQNKKQKYKSDFLLD